MIGWSVGNISFAELGKKMGERYRALSYAIPQSIFPFDIKYKNKHNARCPPYILRIPYKIPAQRDGA